jgi:uncharacterized protein (TIGR01777 family)
MVPPFKAFLGGPMGNGKQWMSWVALDDVVGMIEMALFQESISGVINAVGPEPVTNKEFVKTLGAVLGRPAVLPVPAPVLRLALGEGADILLNGQRVVPKRAVELEYAFHQPTLRGAMKSGLGLDQ